jgi:hypothetical protein
MILRRRSASARVSGRPPSANGASSLHLRWETAGELNELAVTLTVVEAPRVAKLHFWALQADFSSLGGGLGQQGRPAGGAHLGLQWHPRHPGSTAVNWGGYGPDGRELQGSTSPLPSALRNANTRDFPWSPGVGYRLHIAPAPRGTPAPEGLTPWRASITDTSTGVKVEVRDLYVPGERISAAVMWSEVFADCDDPPVTVGWSHPFAVSASGAPVRVSTMSVNYQSHAEGGCDNTTAWASEEGWFQRTCTPRATPQGAVLRVEPAP